MKYQTETLKEIFQADSNNKLVLPDFQRDFVWELEKQKGLISSLLVGLPIGSILIVEGKKDDFPSRPLIFTERITPKEDCNFLLDGQQRLSCLKSIFDDLFTRNDDWNDVIKKLYGKLQNRWFLKMKPDEGLDDIFGWEKLKFAKKDLEKYDPDQIQDFVVCYKIFVKDKDKAWYHPAYQVVQSSANEQPGLHERKNLLAKEYAKHGVVPLFEIYPENGNDLSLHSLTLRAIANNRRDELKAKVQDGKFSVEDLLGHFNSDISNLTEDEIDEFWSDLASEWRTNIKNALDSLLEQKVSEILLPSEEISRAASIFEKSNEGGTRLSNFDLIVAKNAKTGTESLSDTFKQLLQENLEIPDSICYSKNKDWQLNYMEAMQESLINKVITDQFLLLLSLLSSQTEAENGVDHLKLEYLKQTTILKLKPDQIVKHSKRAMKSLIKAFAFLQHRCGIVYIKDLSYKLMLLPIAYLFSIEEPIEEESINEESINVTIWTDEKQINKIEYWYWSSLFSGSYKDKQNERCLEDIKSLYKWILNETANPFKTRADQVFKQSDYSDDKVLLLQNEQTPPTAIQDGILQYILSQQPKDFLWDSESQPKLKAWDIAKEGKKLEKHHLVPLGCVTDIGENTKSLRNDKKHLLNSPLNLTYISKQANKQITDKEPSRYLSLLSETIVDGHQISPNMIREIKERRPSNYDEEFYREVFLDRFNTLKRAVKVELESLID